MEWREQWGETGRSGKRHLEVRLLNTHQRKYTYWSRLPFSDIEIVFSTTVSYFAVVRSCNSFGRVFCVQFLVKIRKTTTSSEHHSWIVKPRFSSFVITPRLEITSLSMCLCFNLSDLCQPNDYDFYEGYTLIWDTYCFQWRQ